MLPQVDPFTGIVSAYRYDEESKSLIVRRAQDCRELLDLNKAQRDANSQAWRKDDARMLHFARIPNVFIEKWMKEEGWNALLAKTDRHGKHNDEMTRLLRKLESPDFKGLKTTNMRMG